MVCRTWIHNSYDGLNVIDLVGLSRWTGERCRRPRSYLRSCWAQDDFQEQSAFFFRGVARGNCSCYCGQPTPMQIWAGLFYTNKAKTEDMRFGGKDVGKRGSERSRKRAGESVYDQHTLLHVWSSGRKNEWVDKQTNKQTNKILNSSTWNLILCLC